MKFGVTRKKGAREDKKFNVNYHERSKDPPTFLELLANFDSKKFLWR